MLAGVSLALARSGRKSAWRQRFHDLDALGSDALGRARVGFRIQNRERGAGGRGGDLVPAADTSTIKPSITV